MLESFAACQVMSAAHTGRGRGASSAARKSDTTGTTRQETKRSAANFLSVTEFSVGFDEHPLQRQQAEALQTQQLSPPHECPVSALISDTLGTAVSTGDSAPSAAASGARRSSPRSLGRRGRGGRLMTSPRSALIDGEQPWTYY
jgi:hypothetical protein